MATKILTFPFTQGMDEGTTAKELQPGKMQEAVNVRQRRNSSMGQRPDYASVANTEFGGTLVPYDLYNLNGRLFAVGDRQGNGFPSDVFDFVQSSQGNWRGTVQPGGTGARLPGVTKVRNIGQPPDGVSNIETARCAAINGQVCLVYSVSASTGGSTSYILVVNPSTDQTLFYSSIPLTNAKVAACGTSFWVAGVDASDDLIGYRIQTGVTTSLPSPTTLYTGTVTQQIFDLVQETHTSTINSFAFVVRDASTSVVRRFNENGTQIISFAGPALAAAIFRIESDRVDNTINIASRVGAADIVLHTYNLTTGGLNIGPTSVFADVLTEDVSMSRVSLGSATIHLCADDTGPVVKRSVITTSGHVRTSNEIDNYKLGGKGCISGSSVGNSLIPLLGATDNQVGVFITPGTQVFMPAVSADLGIARDSTPMTHLESPGQICRDFGTGKFYWARLVIGSDGQSIPIMSEFLYGDTARRQTCQIGNETFITGGLPVIDDGRQLAESSFIGRPSVTTIAPTTGGQLLLGATYDYCLVWRWTDSQNLLGQSCVSNISTVTLTGSNNANNITTFAPHTLRKDAVSGSTPTVSLYRTIADGIATSGSVISSRDWSITPAVAGDFNAKTLTLSIDVGAGQTFTFGATDNTPLELIVKINATITGGLASLVGNFIQIASTSTGTTSSVTITGGTTVDVGGSPADSGFFSGQTNSGTKTFTKGTVFQLAASAVVPVTDVIGFPVTINDGLSDVFLATKAPLYTQGERGALSGILEHNAPPSCEFCWTVGNRVFIGGLANRSEVRISKALFPSESLSFSDDFAFSAFVDGNVTAVAALDGTPLVFTADSVYGLTNQLPDDNGNGATVNASGALGEPIRIPSEAGCINAYSIVEVSTGLFYQQRDNKLMLLPRGGGSPVWVGTSVQDTLDAFPNITAACYADRNHTIAWTCMNLALTQSQIIILDVKTGQWSVDDLGTGHTLKSAVDWDGRIVILDGTTIRMESTSLIPSVFITYHTRTGGHQPFQGNGWGKIVSVTADMEFRGNCKVTALISYDDGLTFTTMKSFTYTTAGGFVVGQTITAQWFPARRKCSQYMVDFIIADDGAATASAGVNLNKYTVELEGSFPQKVRTSSAQRG